MLFFCLQGRKMWLFKKSKKKHLVKYEFSYYNLLIFKKTFSAVSERCFVNLLNYHYYVTLGIVTTVISYLH